MTKIKIFDMKICNIFNKILLQKIYFLSQMLSIFATEWGIKTGHRIPFYDLFTFSLNSLRLSNTNTPTFSIYQSTNNCTFFLIPLREKN